MTSDKRAKRRNESVVSDSGMPYIRKEQAQADTSKWLRKAMKKIEIAAAGTLLASSLAVGQQMMNVSTKSGSSESADRSTASVDSKNTSNWRIQMGSSFVNYNDTLKKISVDITLPEEDKTDDNKKNYAIVYLLNGLTSTKWLQIGVSPNWGNTSAPGTSKERIVGSYDSNYKVVYMAYNRDGSISTPENGSSINNITASPGDKIRLSMRFMNPPYDNMVAMEATNLTQSQLQPDGNTRSFTYDVDVGSASTFIMTKDRGAVSGFFTGVMTESFHMGPKISVYNGKSVRYELVDMPNTDVYSWICEFNSDKNGMANGDTYGSKDFIPSNKPHTLSFLNLRVTYSKGEDNAREIITGSESKKDKN